MIQPALLRPRSTTPRDAIHTRGPMTVYRFRPGGGALEPLPVVLVPSIINRARILDLREGQSFAAYLGELGLDVYLIEWGEPRRVDAQMGLEEYAVASLRSAIGAVRAVSGAPAVHLFGYCLGGTFALIGGALGLPGIASIQALATPVDLTDPGPIGILTDARLLDVTRVAEAFPVVPGALTWAAFQLLDPIGVAGKWRLLARRVREREFRRRFSAQESWLSDPVPMTGRALRDVVQRLYRENALARETLELAGRTVRLGEGRVPVLNLIAQSDTIVPPAASRALASLWGGEVVTLEYPGGHIGVTVGSRARDWMWKDAGAWLVSRQEIST